MSRVIVLGVLATLVVWSSVAAQGLEPQLSLEQVVELAKTRAPAIVEAQAALDEREGMRVAASRRFDDSIALEAGAGPRRASGTNSTDIEFAVAQSFGSPGARSARIRSSAAGLRAAEADLDSARSNVIAEAALLFAAVLTAKELRALAQSSEALANELQRVTRARLDAGDVTILEVNLAQAEHASAEAERGVAEAMVSRSLGNLRGLLGVTTQELADVRGTFGPASVYERTELIARAKQRSDLRALAAEVDVAKAELDLLRSAAKPVMGARASYATEDDAEILMAGLTLSFPAPRQTSGARLQAEARLRAAESRYAWRERVLESTVDAALSELTSLSAAENALRTAALPVLAESESLALTAFEEGERGLFEVLQVRRTALETRRAYVERLADVYRATISLELISGVLR